MRPRTVSQAGEIEQTPLRALFCIGVTQTFFDADVNERAPLFDAIVQAFANLSDRFGVRVLGTLDDDRTMVGSSSTWPWTCYLLADIPSYKTAIDICNIIRETKVGDFNLWRYLKVEARIGRPLFFGND